MKFKHLLFLTVLMILKSCGQSSPKSELSSEKSPFPKLFLLSKGLVTDTLKNEFLKFIEKDPSTQSVAVIVNATKSQTKKVKKTKKVKRRFAEIGFDSTKIEMFDLNIRNPRDLSEFDIIYVLGGNPFVLLDEVRKSKANMVLKELTHQEKIMMGYSAGALLFGPSLDLMNDVDSLLGFNEIQLQNLSCLEIYDFLIFPHYEEFTSEVEGLAEEIDQFELKSNYKIHRLNDHEGIIFENGKMRLIGN